MRFALGLLAALALAPASALAAPTDIERWSGTFSASCASDAQVCPEIPRGQSSDDLVIANLTMNVVDEPFDDRFPDQGNVRVRFTPRHAYCSHVSINFTGTKDGAGDWHGTFSPATGSWWNAPANRTQELPMFLDEGLWRIAVSAFATPGCPTGAGRAAYAFKVEIAWVAHGAKGASLKVPGERTGDISTRHGVGFQGSGWNPRGGPISVRFGHEVVKRFGAARRFHGSLDLSRFPTQTADRCEGTLTATQGGTTRSLRLKGRPERSYYLADGLTYPDGAAMKKGAILCRGLEPKSKRTHAAVYAPLTKPQTGLVIDDRPGGVQVDGAWFESPASRIDLGLGGGRRATIVPDADIGPFLPGVAAREPANPTHTFVTSDPVTEPDPVTLNEGTTLSRSSMIFNVGLVLHDPGSSFFVRGDLRVDGALRGSGGLATTGSMELRGTVNLTQALVEAAGVLRVGR